MCTAPQEPLTQWLLVFFARIVIDKENLMDTHSNVLIMPRFNT